MFEGEREQRTPKEKSVYLILNGSPGKVFTHTFKRNLTTEEILRAVERAWGPTKYKPLRIFTMEGVEILGEELIYVREGDKLYVSRGEEFDSNSNFGEYQLTKVLGEGGFGKVSLGRNIITNELAAIKVVKLEKIYGATDIDMVFREIENLKALNHPNIVRILNCYTLQNMQVVVVMEYLQGGELLQHLKAKGTFSESVTRAFFKQLISAVAYCHNHNIIHRDLKLENILMKDQQTIKVADFGISGVADRINPDADTGTLKYMSPEILAGKQKSNTPAVDVWACGVILYYMLFGSLPFTGASSSHIIQSIIAGKLIFPKYPAVSIECKILLQAMLEVNPKKRLKINEVEESVWLVNWMENGRSEPSIDQIIEETQPKKGVNQNIRKVAAKIQGMLIPKRLERERIKVIQELEGFGMDPRKVYRSENKNHYGSQELPAINGCLRASRRKVEESLQKHDELGKRKRTSIFCGNLWK